MKPLYKFICSYLEENKLNIFRWKLIQYIIPTKKLLFQWEIVNNNRCSFCGNEEVYLHYFITCSFLKTFWERIYNLLKSNNLEFTLKLKHLIFGYRISDNNYYSVNYFITILGFSIYKSYYLSEQKIKNVNVYNFFIYELNIRIYEIKNHSMNNSCLYAMKKKIIVLKYYYFYSFNVFKFVPAD